MKAIMNRLVAVFAMSAALSVTAVVAEDRKMEPVELTDIRQMRYCEFLLIFDDRVDIYNTSANDGCPEDKWQKLDTAELAKDHGAKAAQLNGPKFWTMDEQTIRLGDTKTFGGIDARYAASLPTTALSGEQGSKPYTGFTSSKKQTMVFKAGLPIYELVDAEGNAYILNAYGPNVRDGDPANLIDQLKPAEGWTYRVTTPEQDLVVAAPSDSPTHMVGDDMHQYYTKLEE